MRQRVWAQAWGFAWLRSVLAMLVWLVWERTEFQLGASSPTCLISYLGVLLQTPKSSPFPQTPEMASLGRKRGSLYLALIINAAKPFETSRPGLPQPEKQGLPFRSAPGPWAPRLSARGGSRLGARGIFQSARRPRTRRMPRPITCLVIGIYWLLMSSCFSIQETPHIPQPQQSPKSLFIHRDSQTGPCQFPLEELADKNHQMIGCTHS